MPCPHLGREPGCVPVATCPRLPPRYLRKCWHLDRINTASASLLTPLPLACHRVFFRSSPHLLGRRYCAWGGVRPWDTQTCVLIPCRWVLPSPITRCWWDCCHSPGAVFCG